MQFAIYWKQPHKPISDIILHLIPKYIGEEERVRCRYPENSMESFQGNSENMKKNLERI